MITPFCHDGAQQMSTRGFLALLVRKVFSQHFGQIFEEGDNRIRRR